MQARPAGWSLTGTGLLRPVLVLRSWHISLASLSCLHCRIARAGAVLTVSEVGRWAARPSWDGLGAGCHTRCYCAGPERLWQVLSCVVLRNRPGAQGGAWSCLTARPGDRPLLSAVCSERWIGSSVERYQEVGVC